MVDETEVVESGFKFGKETAYTIEKIEALVDNLSRGDKVKYGYESEYYEVVSVLGCVQIQKSFEDAEGKERYINRWLDISGDEPIARCSDPIRARGMGARSTYGGSFDSLTVKPKGR